MAGFMYNTSNAPPKFWINGKPMPVKSMTFTANGSWHITIGQHEAITATQKKHGKMKLHFTKDILFNSSEPFYNALALAGFDFSQVTKKEEYGWGIILHYAGKQIHLDASKSLKKALRSDKAREGNYVFKYSIFFTT